MAKQAMTWGSITWIANIAGCILGSNPLAAPLIMLSTIATLITGFFAMGFGVRAAAATDDPDALREARWGYALGMSHLIIVAIVLLLFWLATESGLLESAIFE